LMFHLIKLWQNCLFSSFSPWPSVGPKCFVGRNECDDDITRGLVSGRFCGIGYPIPGARLISDTDTDTRYLRIWYRIPDTDTYSGIGYLIPIPLIWKTKFNPGKAS
jgi:hypothetical protein